mmetsp:Transcript_38885/g.64734  ORF Transcript_38885/g.64734 Transcript_38885/m.64734 type:complete len:944 (-) Transcript_38885:210-3041(-)
MYFRRDAFAAFVLIFALGSTLAQTQCSNVKCVDPTCGVPLAPFEQNVPCAIIDEECTDEHIGMIWTACDNTTSMRAIQAYYRVPALCRGGKQLPPPVLNVSCDLVCDGGTTLDISTMTCIACPLGQYSLGGAAAFTKWDPLPAQFFTECRGLHSAICNPWRSRGNGSVIESGNHLYPEINSIESVLSLRILLVRPGWVSFEYKVDAEPEFDGLTVYIDDVLVMRLASQQPDWTTFSYNITAGYHSIKFVYTKDYSLSYGQDRAWIREVTVMGTSYAAMKCSNCSVGSASNTTSATKCSLCPRDTYSDSPGLANCIPCPSTHYALSGASVCTPRPPCEFGLFYVAHEGPCLVTSTGTFARNITYSMVEPIICDIRNFTLPSPTQVPCQLAPCVAGQYRQPGVQGCSYCDEGTYRSEGSDTCQYCGEGHAAVKSYAVNDWSTWPSLMVNMSSGVPHTSCDGDCATSGWQLGGGFLFSGSGHGHFVDIHVSMEIVMVTSGSISFAYHLQCPEFVNHTFQGSPRLHYIVDGRLTDVYFCNDAPVGNKTFPLPPGPHTVTWNWRKRSYLGSSQDVAYLDWVVVQGANVGGGYECRPCLPGTFSAGGRSLCQLCPPGYSSSSSMARQCDACPANTFAAAEGSALCMKCGPHTSSASAALQCNYSCGFTSTDGRSYDLSALDRAEEYGPLNGSSSASQVFLSICSAVSNRTCKDLDDRIHQAFVCEKDAQGNAYSAGSVIGFSTLSSDSSQLGVMISYGYGDPVSVSSNSTLYRQSYVHLICSPADDRREAESQRPTITYSDGVVTNITWRTPFACPLCSALDMGNVTSDCEGGQRTTRYFWKDEKQPQRCQQGIPLPAPTVQSCSRVPWSGIIGATLSALVLAPAAVFAFVQYRKYRRLYSQYETLSTSQQRYGTELDGMEIGRPDEDSDEQLSPASPPRRGGGGNHLR